MSSIVFWNAARVDFDGKLDFGPMRDLGEYTGYSTTGVAQLAISYILNFACSMALQQLMIERGNYSNFSTHVSVPLFELQHKTLGIVGLGAIGRQVARIAHALNMKIVAYLINTSRGPLVNEVDLLEALKAGELAGAGLDVQEVEPATPDNPLFHEEQVFLTPHIGWKTIESRQRLVQLLAENISAYMSGTPKNTVS